MLLIWVTWDLCVIANVVSYNLCWKLECWLYIFTTTRANRVCKSFSLSLSVCQLNCLRKSKCLSLGKLIRLQRIYFSKHFCPCLDSNLHDLNGTNPDWRCFQQNYHGVIYVQEQTFSEWPETSRRHFSENKKNTCQRWRPGGSSSCHKGGAHPHPCGQGVDPLQLILSPIFLLIPKIISVNFQVIPRTFISA